jgi:hypothetical protein
MFRRHNNRFRPRPALDALRLQFADVLCEVADATAGDSALSPRFRALAGIVRRHRTVPPVVLRTVQRLCARLEAELDMLE